MGVGVGVKYKERMITAARKTRQEDRKSLGRLTEPPRREFKSLL